MHIFNCAFKRSLNWTGKQYASFLRWLIVDFPLFFIALLLFLFCFFFEMMVSLPTINQGIFHNRSSREQWVFDRRRLTRESVLCCVLWDTEEEEEKKKSCSLRSAAVIDAHIRINKHTVTSHLNHTRALRTHHSLSLKCVLISRQYTVTLRAHLTQQAH